MKITAIKTPLVQPGDDLFELISESLLEVPEKSILVVTSKIIGLCENRVFDVDQFSKHDLVINESAWYLEPSYSNYQVMLTIANNQLFVNAGIDESNVENQFVLWPQNPQEWANEIWQFLKEEYYVSQVGVIISDSKTTPLQWGVTGASLAHAGFLALNNKIGQPDLFGRAMKMTKVNVAQALASASVLEMGETNEQMPLALIEDVREVVYQDRVPSQAELDSLVIDKSDDIYAPLLNSVTWLPGKRN